jgi:hypothetical protein
MATELPASIPDTRNLPEQPVTSIKFASDNQVEFLDTSIRYQPVGQRLVIQLPYITDDNQPILAVRISPFMGDSPISAARGGKNVYYTPFYPLPGNEHVIINKPAVYMVKYDHPPALHYLACAHRFWRGSIKYLFRCVSNFTVQGYMRCGVIKGTISQEIITDFSDIGNSLANTNRKVWGCNDGNRRLTANAFVRSDLSMFRHIEVECPYENTEPFVDHYRWLSHLGDCMANSSVNQGSYMPPDNFIILAAGSPLTSPVEGSQLIYDIEIAAGLDFQVATEYFYSKSMIQSRLTGFHDGKDIQYPNAPYPPAVMQTFPNRSIIPSGPICKSNSLSTSSSHVIKSLEDIDLHS